MEPLESLEDLRMDLTIHVQYQRFQSYRSSNDGGNQQAKALLGAKSPTEM